jgi:hypothetical protein
MFGKSEILDVGRTTRTATNAQFRALIARDRHCRAPGCNEPPNRCQAHHTRHWTRGGPTDLDNLELLCRHHHRQRHIEDARAAGRNLNNIQGNSILPRAIERPTP